MSDYIKEFIDSSENKSRAPLNFKNNSTPVSNMIFSSTPVSYMKNSSNPVLNMKNSSNPASQLSSLKSSVPSVFYEQQRAMYNDKL